ncbi:MAG: DUF418 domain-containing protein [Sphingomonadales bacterium]|nr:DUF418 domain-containing protein [Sphingomonadales bacterium]
MSDPSDRVVSLDLIRGVAVLGILAVNIAGFAGPSAATLTPHVPHPATVLDQAAFAAVFVLFEGKMRALFTILFGASLLLFIDRAEANGHNGDVLQLRRLAWLLLFGQLHYFLFWWGDILFIYAVAGILALFARQLPSGPLLVAALVVFIGWHLAGLIGGLPDVRAEEHVRLGLASAGEAKSQGDFIKAFVERAADELAEYRLGFADQLGIKLSERPFWLLETTWPNLGETLPLVFIGMVLLRSGFFAGAWPRRRMIALAVSCGLIGGTMTLAMLGWLWPRQFPPRAMSIALLYATALPHLLMALAYAALLVLAAPRLAATGLGRRLIAAGRMAFTNYIGTTLVMTAIFYGWGLGLIGTVGHAGQLIFVALGWGLMLCWSQPWLARFRQGPLEWLWRSLTERRPLPMRRQPLESHSQ